MQIIKTDSEVLSIRKTVSNKFTITNDKNETMDIKILNYEQDDEVAGWDSTETIYNDDEKEINWSDIETFIGEENDINDLQDKIDRLKNN